VAAGPGFVLFFELEMIKGALVGSGFQEDVAALATITAVRAPTGNEAFASKADASSSTVAGLYDDGGFIDEFHAA
jgi:hypothetical protein